MGQSIALENGTKRISLPIPIAIWQVIPYHHYPWTTRQSADHSCVSVLSFGTETGGSNSIVLDIIWTPLYTSKKYRLTRHTILPVGVIQYRSSRHTVRRILVFLFGNTTLLVLIMARSMQAITRTCRDFRYHEE